MRNHSPVLIKPNRSISPCHNSFRQCAQRQLLESMRKTGDLIIFSPNSVSMRTGPFRRTSSGAPPRAVARKRRH
jgi:hypothetical protein